MKTYDMIVIGSGYGAIIADEAVEHGLKVALVEKGPLGGTCLNLGMYPIKNTDLSCRPNSGNRGG